MPPEGYAAAIRQARPSGRGATAPCNSRLSRRIRIEPLAPEDTAQFLRTRLRRAGCEGDLFTPAAVIALHEAVGGAMREPDRLAQASG